MGCGEWGVKKQGCRGEREQGRGEEDECEEEDGELKEEVASHRCYSCGQADQRPVPACWAAAAVAA